MSGIEVAGLVLGAIPLIISAIEHYESGLDRTKVFFKWQDVLEKARRDLWVQYSSYEMTLRLLLVDLSSEAELEELLSEPKSTLWDNPELVDGLRGKLGETYQVYVYTVQQMEGCVKTLARHLDIDRPNVCFHPRRYSRKRTKILTTDGYMISRLLAPMTSGLY